MHGWSPYARPAGAEHPELRHYCILPAAGKSVLLPVPAPVLIPGRRCRSAWTSRSDSRIACASYWAFPSAAAMGERRPLELPPIYLCGIWLIDPAPIGVTSLYAFQVTEEARKAVRRARRTTGADPRQHLTQLDGLAAAAAHELGTPLFDHLFLISRESRKTVQHKWRAGRRPKTLPRTGAAGAATFSPVTQLSSSGAPFDRCRCRP